MSHPWKSRSSKESYIPLWKIIILMCVCVWGGVMGRANLCARGIWAYMPLGMALWRPGNYMVEILRPQVISYATANQDPHFECLIMQIFVKFVLWKTTLKLKQAAYENAYTLSCPKIHRAYLPNIQMIYCSDTKASFYCPDLGNSNSWGKWINTLQISSIIAWDPSKSDVWKF